MIQSTLLLHTVEQFVIMLLPSSGLSESATLNYNHSLDLLCPVLSLMWHLNDIENVLMQYFV